MNRNYIVTEAERVREREGGLCNHFSPLNNSLARPSSPCDRPMLQCCCVSLSLSLSLSSFAQLTLCLIDLGGGRRRGGEREREWERVWDVLGFLQVPLRGHQTSNQGYSVCVCMCVYCWYIVHFVFLLSLFSSSFSGWMFTRSEWGLSFRPY